MTDQSYCLKCSNLLRGEPSLYAHVKCSKLSAKREHLEENFRSVSSKTKATVISSEKKILSYAATHSQTLQNSKESCFEPCSYWYNPKKAKKELTKNIYKQVVHCKAIFFMLPRNKKGLMFIDSLKEILFTTLNDSIAETAINCAMVMPHLILAKTRTKNDASNNKTFARQIDQ